MDKRTIAELIDLQVQLEEKLENKPIIDILILQDAIEKTLKKRGY